MSNVCINVKYFDSSIPDEWKLKFIGGINTSNWVDLRSSAKIELKSGDFVLIPLGVAVELPAGYEAHVVPRSSTFKNYGIIQTNGMGIIDSSYCGDEDEWFMPVYATRPTTINKGERICQFRLQKVQEQISFNEVKHTGYSNRGGHGSTGKN